MWTRNLAEETKVNGRIRKSFWRSLRQYRSGRDEVGRGRGRAVEMWYARWNRQPTKVIWGSQRVEVGVR